MANAFLASAVLARGGRTWDNYQNAKDSHFQWGQRVPIRSSGSEGSGERLGGQLARPLVLLRQLGELGRSGQQFRRDFDLVGILARHLVGVPGQRGQHALSRFLRCREVGRRKTGCCRYC